MIQLLKIATVGCFLLVVGCSESWYSKSDFYPSGENWQYRVDVRVSTTETGPMTRAKNRKVSVKVFDKKKNNLLLNEFNIFARFPRVYINWAEFELIEIRLTDERYFSEKYREKYDYKPLIPPEKYEKIVVYLWDEKEKKFVSLQGKNDKNKDACFYCFWSYFN